MRCSLALPNVLHFTDQLSVWTFYTRAIYHIPCEAKTICFSVAYLLLVQLLPGVSLWVWRCKFLKTKEFHCNQYDISWWSLSNGAIPSWQWGTLVSMILMFVCLQKDTKGFCKVKMLDRCKLFYKAVATLRNGQEFYPCRQPGYT